VDRQRGLLVLDDTTLDKPYARQMERVTFHWSGKQRRVVQGIALMTLLWTQGQALLPCDFRVYDKPAGGQSKNQHFREMLQTAHGRGFRPAYVRMDSWYASLENLKQIAALGWRFLTRLKHNRLVNPDGRGNRPIEAVAIPPEGRAVHLKGFGFVRVFRTVSRDGDAEYWATNDLQMEEGKRAELERQGWGIRALKQCCGVERAQVRKAVAILGHLLLALRAFLRLEVYRLRTGLSWYEAKAAIVRDAIRHYLAHPIHTLQPTA
jgi:putative transposase